MKTVWLSPWLYRLLPVIYLIGGSLMFFAFGDETIGRLSGFLLYAAAALILVLRLIGRSRGPHGRNH